MSLTQLLEKKIRTFIYTTGAGAGAQKELWNIPGCSSFLVGCGFPYDTKLTSKIIGYTPKQFASMETAAELAMAAYMEAYDPNVLGVDTIGIGLSGSVASNSAHRGDHRLYIVAISNNKVHTSYVKLGKGFGVVQRENDGLIADRLILETLKGMADVNGESGLNSFKYMYNGSCYTLEIVSEDNTNLIGDLLLQRPFFKSDGTKCSLVDFFGETNDYSDYVFYPGTFNPFHDGHLTSAKESFKTAVHLNDNMKDFIFTTCIHPVHKAPPTVQEILQRVKQMRSQNFLLTMNDPYFVDKSKMFPGGMIAVGADTLISLFDPKWGKDPKDVLDIFKENNTRILVRGRVVDGEFQKLSDVRAKVKLMQDASYYKIFAHVNGRNDLSSTELRQKIAASST